MTTTLVTAGMPVRINLQTYRGDTWIQCFRFLHGDTPVDLTDLTPAAAARASTGTRTPLTATILGDGTIQLALPIGGLPPDLYDYDLQVSAPDGTVATWVAGKLRVSRDIT
jgi:hypothetical protein